MTRARAIVVLVVLVPTTGCASGGDASSPTTRLNSYAALYAGLCRTRAQATQPAAARGAFFDRVHLPLHELAARPPPRVRCAWPYWPPR